MPKRNFLLEAERKLHAMRIPEALRLYHLAERANQDADSCAGGRWECHMLNGDFELAWRESDAIQARGRPDPNRFWDGRPLHGRDVILRCLHGLGDSLQFLRYAPVIREQARSFTIEAQPALKRLISEANLAPHVITWGEPQPAWNQQIEIVELPRVFRTTLATIPNRVPYIDVKADCSLFSDTPRKGNDLRVGFVWASSSYNTARSIPLDQFAALFEIPRVSFFSLQAGEERAQLTPWSGKIPSLYDESACVLATAETLKQLDLIITADTMMAHLAGAMNRPVWTLLPFECDWRWMLKREDSPWYPSMRLFRQPKPGDWSTVLGRVRHALIRLEGCSPRQAAGERRSWGEFTNSLVPEA